MSFSCPFTPGLFSALVMFPPVVTNWITTLR